LKGTCKTIKVNEFIGKMNDCIKRCDDVQAVFKRSMRGNAQMFDLVAVVVWGTIVITMLVHKFKNGDEN